MTNQTSRNIRILHLISGDLWAGAEVMAFNLLRSLNEFPDIDLQVILLNDGRLADELRSLGIAVQIVDEKQHSFWKIYQDIQAIIGTNRPDIIHAHRYKENLLAFMLSKRCRKVKLISTLHGLPEVAGRRPGLITRLKSRTNFFLLAKFFTKTVAVSNDIGSSLIDHFGFAHKRVAAIHNGMRLPPLPSFSVRDGQPFVIGSSGRLFPIKDYPLMIEIARVIAASGTTDIRFELAGDGPERGELERLIHSYGLQDLFILRGHQDDMDSFYRGLNVYINTSVHEGIPMTILEALSHGLPVIAPAVGGIVEIVENGVEGFLIEGRNPQDFAAKCLQLYEDAELSELMSKAARKRAERDFSADIMAERYYQIYRL